jgi:hypothetical protein
MTRILLLASLTVWKLASQASDAPITASILGQVYDASASSVLVFTGTPGTARAIRKTPVVAGAQCTYTGSAALWFCVAPDGHVSVLQSDGSSVRALDVPVGPAALAISGSGSALALWYPDLYRLYLVTASNLAIRLLTPSAPVAELLAVSDDGALVLARGDDACAWLMATEGAPRCVQSSGGKVAGAFTAGNGVLLAYRQSGQIYLAQAGDYATQLLAGPADGVVEPVAALGVGTQAFVADRGAGVIRVIDLSTNSMRTMRAAAPPTQFLPLSKGLYLTTSFSSGSLALLETGSATRIVAATLDTGGGQ